MCVQEIDESKVAIDMHDENFVSLRRLMFELQRSLKSAAINNNVLLKHFEGSIQNKVLRQFFFCLAPPLTRFIFTPQESLIDKLSMKCIVGDKKRETLQAQLSSGTNDGEVFGTIDFDQLQIENSQLQVCVRACVRACACWCMCIFVFANCKQSTAGKDR